MFFTYLLWGGAYGFAAAMQPGPFQTYLITQTLHHGWRRTLPMVAAPLLSDGPIIVLVVLVLSRVPPWWLQALRLVGGLYVVFLAWGTWRAWQQSVTAPAAPSPSQTVLRAALINLLNPGPYLFWSLVTGPLLVSGWQAAPLNAVGLLTGFYCTLLAGLVGVMALGAGARRLGPQVNHLLLGVSGLMLLGFGLYQVATGLGWVWPAR